MKREMKLPDFVQAFVNKKTGRAYYYFRRGGSSSRHGRFFY